MRIAIIGGGMTGLSAAYELTGKGHSVMLFEKNAVLGGLAAGFKEANWSWPLEQSYHHWFTNDRAMLTLLRDIGLSEKIILKRPVTATLWHDLPYQLDSGRHLLLFPALSPVDKVRTALLLGLLKLNPFWQPLESLSAQSLIRIVGGNEAWRVIWEPLLQGKFGGYSNLVAASWFWARIHKRTSRLMYLSGGFQTLINTLERRIQSSGGVISANCVVTKVFPEKRSGSFILTTNRNGRHTADRILLTVPTAIAARLLPLSYPTPIPHLHAVTLVLETKQPIMRRTYWLNITDRSYPFLAVVAHTNFIDKRHYGNHHITYVGNYLPQDHPLLSVSAQQLFRAYVPSLKRLTPRFSETSVVSMHRFIGYAAQPVHELHYSRRAPTLATPIPGIFLANLDSIYPWDRGTNYAVELGKNAARAIDAAR
ncbi:FAD-dependent oxidoreductase [Patescibacteria group bacterium]|nr:FAD-dependent oxidoreductase [Patescibacteria group bacterium]